MSSRKELLAKVYKIVPPMLESFHKGQLGRVAVIGGSEDYTGAPYFSAMASAKLGCDLSHVICEPNAAAVIKTYSPNLMVHPYMRQSTSLSQHASSSSNTPAQQVIAMLSRLHVIVVGPGLGRDETMQDTCAEVLAAARKHGLPVVIDADGLQLAQHRPELVKGWAECVLTPNVVEFQRLADAMGVDTKNGAKDEVCSNLAKAYGGVTIIQKGPKDVISNGTVTLVSDGEGGLKRSGGQGDTLTGCLATLLAWRNAYHEGLWEREGQEMAKEETLAVAVWGGSAITRECSRLAFKDKGRSLQAGDLTERVHDAFIALIGEKGSKL